jgi:membrane fusion protein, copper/silver efflux system
MRTLAKLALGFVVGALLVAGLWRLEGAHQQHQPAEAAQAAAREILYYRNPMGAPDISPVPKKDSMGMDYIPVYADEGAAGFSGNVLISSAVQHNLGVRTASVLRKRLRSEIGTVAFVQYDESRLTHLHTLTEGWIRRLHAHTVGERVRAGQLLLTLYSPQLLSAQGEMLAAWRGGNAAVVAAAQQRLRLLGVNEQVLAQLRAGGKPLEEVPIVAAHDGYVDQLQVREGMFVTPELEMMTIGNLTSVWVIAEVFERQIGAIDKGAAVEISSRSYPGRSWQGKVDFIYPMLERDTRTARLRIVVENADEALKPNMAVDLRFVMETADERLAIPRDALIRGGSGDRVVKRHADGSFGAVAVSAGREYGEEVEVLDGLRAGDVVVTAAQFLIDSESGIKAELQRLQAEP